MTCHAMRLVAPGRALEPAEISLPKPASTQIMINVTVCGVCRTDLHLMDGEVSGKLPIVPGHQVVGHVAAMGKAVTEFEIGDRVGVPWLAWTCGKCSYCREGRENLCDNARFTGVDVDGGYASHCVAEAAYCLPIPDAFADAAAAPLLCAGLIGYRALRMAGDARRIAFYGFGAAAHILAQIAVAEGREIYAFTKRGDDQAKNFARSLGCTWAGGSDEPAPLLLDAAIIFAPAGVLVPQAMAQLRKGGTVVCAGIHMSDIPSFPYRLLWGERSLRSVANLTRQDGRDFMVLAARIPIHTHVHELPLDRANEALAMLRQGEITGSIVLRT